MKIPTQRKKKTKQKPIKQKGAKIGKMKGQNGNFTRQSGCQWQCIRENQLNLKTVREKQRKRIKKESEGAVPENPATGISWKLILWIPCLGSEDHLNLDIQTQKIIEFQFNW